MVKLTKVFKNSFLLFLLFSCASSNELRNNYFGFILSSVYDTEEVFLKLNDSIILNNVKINTDRALGVDMKNQFTFETSIAAI